jgi:inorganic pyrophosphatase
MNVPDEVLVVVEIPAGSRNKYEFDPSVGGIVLDRMLFTAPLRDPMWSHVGDLEDLLPTLRAEVEHFFSVYKDLEGKPTGTEDFGDRAEATRVIEAARRRAGP